MTLILNDGQVVDYTKTGEVKMDERFKPRPLKHIEITEITIAEEEELSIDDVHEEAKTEEFEPLVLDSNELAGALFQEVSAMPVDEEITKSAPWTDGFVHTSGFCRPIGDPIPLSPMPEEPYVISNRGFDAPIASMFIYPPLNPLYDVEEIIKAKLSLLKEVHKEIYLTKEDDTLFVKLITNHAKTAGYIEALEYVLEVIGR